MNRRSFIAWLGAGATFTIYAAKGVTVKIGEKLGIIKKGDRFTITGIGWNKKGEIVIHNWNIKNGRFDKVHKLKIFRVTNVSKDGGTISLGKWGNDKI